jgi:hypothetical protein
MIQRSGMSHAPMEWVPFFVFIAILAFEGFWKIFVYIAKHMLGPAVRSALTSASHLLFDGDASDGQYLIHEGLAQSGVLAETFLEWFSPTGSV